MSFETKKVTSSDGTPIAYYKIGQGPGLVIVHGAMQSGQSHTELATLLSKNFTCYLPDRRGRGQSGPLKESYSVSDEVADIQRLVKETGSPYVFGVSSGALLTLKAASEPSVFKSAISKQPQARRSSIATSPILRKIAVFDPPWHPESERQATVSWVHRYEEELKQGACAEAFATAMLGSKMGPPFLHSSWIPRWSVVSLAKVLLAGGTASSSSEANMARQMGGGQASAAAVAASKTLPPRPSFSQLAQVLRTDIQIGQDMFGEKKLQMLASVGTETLILGGSYSPAYMQRSTQELEKVLPNARREEIQGAYHTVTENREQTGNPEMVAERLKQFFLGERVSK